MTDTQLYRAIGLPIVVNAAALGIVAMLLMTHMNTRLEGTERSINQRFDDMRELWRTELRRVEEVLDARLNHIEEKLGIR